MNPDALRLQAFMLADKRAKPGASLKSVTADAETILAWFKADGTGSDTSAQPEPTNQPSTTHESQAAVEGQEPKGE